MEIPFSLASILPLAAAANGLIFAVAIGLRARSRGAKTGIFAATYLLSAAVAIAAITIDHAAADAPSWIGLLEAGATLAAGPMFFLFIAALTGASIPAPLGMAPAAIILAAALLASNDPRLVAERFVPLQIGYTIAAVAIVLVRKNAEQKRLRLAVICLAGAGILHAAQIARFVWPTAAPIRDLVPYVGTIAFFALAGAVYAGARLKALEHILSPPVTPPAGAPALLAKIDDALRSSCAEPDLSVDALAARLGAPASKIEATLKALRGIPFRDALREARVAKAKVLLGDPAEARTSMEAIGLLAGFRSRSVFYDAFRASTGMSPAAYRKENAAENCPEG